MIRNIEDTVNVPGTQWKVVATSTAGEYLLISGLGNTIDYSAAGIGTWGSVGYVKADRYYAAAPGGQIFTLSKVTGETDGVEYIGITLKGVGGFDKSNNDLYIDKWGPNGVGGAITFVPVEPLEGTYLVTASAGSGGSISPSGSVTVSQGSSQQFTFTPNTGYEINQVTVNGSANSTAKANGYYTFSNVTANHTISITFKLKQYTITPNAGNGGTISPSDAVTVNYGSSQTFTFTPDTGYEIDQALIDGINDATAVWSRGYTFSNITDNHSVSVTFKQSCIPDIIVRVWDDILSIINDPANNGGYTFDAYQWQRNGEDIAGETLGNLYLSGEKAVAGEYSCRLGTSTGQIVETCPVSWSAIPVMSVHPNPTSGIVNIVSSGMKAGDIIGVYNAIGTVVFQIRASGASQVALDLTSLAKGVYVVRVNGEQGRIIKN